MPRYFFHIHNDIDVPDEEGQEKADNLAAMQAALDYARDLASTSVRSGTLNLQHFIVCVNEQGHEVGIVRFADAVQVEG